MKNQSNNTNEEIKKEENLSNVCGNNPSPNIKPIDYGLNKTMDYDTYQQHNIGFGHMTPFSIAPNII